MALRTLSRLRPLTVERTKAAGMYADGGGLYLQVKSTTAKSWIFRFVVDGRERHMGLGSTSTFSLAEAREAARECRKLLHNDIDPIEHRDSGRMQKRLDAARTITFGECADAYIAAHEESWRNAKHRSQWRNTLRDHAGALRDLPVVSIDTALVLKVLEPLWREKTETASRLRGRIESVIDWATTREYRQGENPARWKGHLENLLPKRSRLAPTVHLAALPYPEIPQLMAELRQRGGAAARALAFTILTAVRTGESLGAQWDEIDLRNAVWTIPAARMKAGKEHRVPLTDRMLEILATLPRTSDFIFAGAGAGKPLASSQLYKQMKRMRPEYTVHGHRSAFRDWCAERTNFPREVAEMALGHAVGSAVERAYQRGDLFEKRRRLMSEWSRYCSEPPATGDVISLRRL
jgi:integrase